MTTTTELMSTAEILGGLVTAMASGRIRVIDLTQTLTPEFPQIALPPEMGQCWPFRIEEVSKYDERGPGWEPGERTRFGRYAARLWTDLLDAEQVEER